MQAQSGSSVEAALSRTEELKKYKYYFQNQCNFSMLMCVYVLFFLSNIATSIKFVYNHVLEYFR